MQSAGRTPLKTTTSTVHLAVYDTLADWEVGLATAHINSGDWQRERDRFQVRTVGAGQQPVTTKGGMRIMPDLTLDELHPSGSAMLILPGADTWLTGGNREFTRHARRFLDAGVPVAAICGATVGLATEGLLDHRAHTSNAAEILAMTGYHGAHQYRDEPAVTDNNLITASGLAPVEFAREIFARLGLYEPEVLSSWFTLYGDRNPAGYTALAAATG